jgi:succinyl-CoA synthetase alpha subunit
VAATGAEASMIFVPPPFAADAILRSRRCRHQGHRGCITEGIPVLDMLRVKAALAARPEVLLIGPNCPGIITPVNARSASCRASSTSLAASASCRVPAR